MYIAGYNGIGELTQQGAETAQQAIKTGGDIITSIWGKNDTAQQQQQQQQQNTSQDLYNQLLLQQYMNQQNQKQDNTLLYVLLGLGVGVLILSMSNNNGKR